MVARYGYKYATIREDGLCLGQQDTTDYILNRLYVPVPSYDIEYLLKYYYPIPDTVTSFDDFQGLWYLDAEHTQLFEEGNV